MNKLSVYTWVKDTNFRFISCSENLTELAGEDSPRGMIGKDDFSLIWRDGANLFREKDEQIIKGELEYINVIETINVVTDNGVAKENILITKTPLFNKKGKCIGIAGSHVNLPASFSPLKIITSDDQDRLFLPKELGNEYLTKQEVCVLKLIILGKTSKQIAKELGVSFRTIEEYTNNLKRKLQCKFKNEIHSVVIQYGISHLLW